MPLSTTTYYATMTSQCSGTIVDSIKITVGSGIQSNLITENTSCSGDDGKVTVTPDILTSQPPWNINILDNNGSIIQSQQNVLSSASFSGLFLAHILSKL